MSSEDGGVATDTNRRPGRWLGITFLVVFVGSFLSEALTLSLFSHSTAETLENIADNSLNQPELTLEP